MSVPAPHFLLFSASQPPDDAGLPGNWSFVLEAVGVPGKIEIADSEPQLHGERLELLAVVRGLEALPQPSRVTLVTPSRYVARGIADGLSDWRDNGWQWERHGEMVPVKNRDLWRRIDRAMQFHRIECRQWRLDGKPLNCPAPAGPSAGGHAADFDPYQASAPSLDSGPAVGTALLSAEHSVIAGQPLIINSPIEQPPRQVAASEAAGRRYARSGRFRRQSALNQRLFWLRIRRALGDWLSGAYLQFRQLAAPLVRAPWLD